MVDPALLIGTIGTSGQESDALHVFTTAAMYTIKYSSTVIPSVFYIQLGH
jgi:hypothetical protein